MDYEVFIQSGPTMFVLTDSPSRAELWSKEPGHVGITPEEIEVLGGATGGRAADREHLDAIIRIKKSMPGSEVIHGG